MFIEDCLIKLLIVLGLTFLSFDRNNEDDNDENVLFRNIIYKKDLSTLNYQQEYVLYLYFFFYALYLIYKTTIFYYSWCLY